MERRLLPRPALQAHRAFAIEKACRPRDLVAVIGWSRQRGETRSESRESRDGPKTPYHGAPGESDAVIRGEPTDTAQELPPFLGSEPWPQLLQSQGRIAGR